MNGFDKKSCNYCSFFLVMEFKVYMHDNVDILLCLFISVNDFFVCHMTINQINEWQLFHTSIVQQLIKGTEMWNITSVARLPSETILDVWKKFDMTRLFNVFILVALLLLTLDFYIVNI